MTNEDHWVNAAISDARSRFEWGFPPSEVVEYVVSHYREIAEINSHLTDSVVDTIHERLNEIFRLED